MSSQPQPLTVGIELEFKVPKGVVDHHPADPRWFLWLRGDDGDSDSGCASDSGTDWDWDLESSNEHVQEKIVSVLEEHGIPAYEDAVWEYLEDEERIELLLQHAKSQDIVLDTTKPIKYQLWSVARETTLDDVDGEQVPGYSYDDTEVELRSRVLTWGQDAKDEIALVLRAIRASMRVNLNRNTGCHVHIGRNHLDLLGWKKLVTLWIFSERFLFQCCEPSRAENKWVLPLSSRTLAATSEPTDTVSAYEEMQQYLPDSLPPILAQQVSKTLKSIWHAPAIVYLRDLLLVKNFFGGTHRSGFALRIFGPLEGTEPLKDVNNTDASEVHTAEIRIMQGTLDPVLIERWIELNICLVQAAEKTQLDFKTLVDKISWAQDLTSFLELLGLGSHADFWKEVQESYKVELQEPSFVKPL